MPPTVPVAGAEHFGAAAQLLPLEGGQVGGPAAEVIALGEDRTDGDTVRRRSRCLHIRPRRPVRRLAERHIGIMAVRYVVGIGESMALDDRRGQLDAQAGPAAQLQTAVVDRQRLDEQLVDERVAGLVDLDRQAVREGR